MGNKYFTKTLEVIEVLFNHMHSIKYLIFKKLRVINERRDPSGV